MDFYQISLKYNPVHSVYQKPIYTGNYLISGYEPVRYQVMPLCAKITADETKELEKLVNMFVCFSKIRSFKGVYLRLDCYISNQMIYVLEINSTSTDGWGQGWHLSRISGLEDNHQEVFFPQFWTTYDPRFQPAINLVISESHFLGYKFQSLEWNSASNINELVYAYLQNCSHIYPDNFVPSYYFLEDKLQFARFAQKWNGINVKIPQHFWFESDKFASLKRLMGKVVLKQRTKDDSSNLKSVIFTSKNDYPGDIIDTLEYLNGNILMQEIVETKTYDRHPIQLICLFAPSTNFDYLKLAGGYIQIADPKSRIINDISAHGPLLIEH